MYMSTTTRPERAKELIGRQVRVSVDEPWEFIAANEGSTPTGKVIEVGQVAGDP